MRLPEPAAFKRKSTFPINTNRWQVHLKTGSSRLSGISVAADFSAKATACCVARRCSLRYANVIFDLDRAAALATVHGYLDELGIAYCGRYGDWGYMWTMRASRAGNKPRKGL